MALAISSLTAGRSATDPATTASITPTAGGVVLLTFSIFRQALDAAAPTDSVSVSGLGGTWTKLDTRSNGAIFRSWFFRGTGLSGSGPITIDYTGPGTVIDIAWVVDQATGQNATTPVSNVSSAGGTGTNLEVTTGGIPDPGDATYSSVCGDTNGDHDPETGWTALTEQTVSRRVESAYDATSPIDTSMDWGLPPASNSSTYIAIINVKTVAVTHLTAGRSNSEPATTASITPTAGGCVLIGVGMYRSLGDAAHATDAITVSGLGGTYTKLATHINSTTGRYWLYQGTGLTGSGGITFDYSGPGTISDVLWVVDQATIQDATTPVSNVASTQATGSPVTVTTTGTPDPGDATYSFIGMDAQTNPTPEAGWTFLGQQTVNRHLETAYDNVGTIDTSCTWTHGGSLNEGTAFIGILNVAADGGGGGTTVQRTLAATATHVSTLTKRLSAKRTLTRTATGTPTLAKRLAVLRRAIVVSSVASPVFLRRATFKRTVFPSSAGTATVAQRRVNIRIFSATAGSVVSLVRRLSAKRTLSASAGNVVTLTRRTTIKRIFSAASTVSSVLQRRSSIKKAFSSSTTGTGTLAQKRVNVRTLAATAGSVVSLVRKVTSRRTLAASAGNVATLARRLSLRRSLTRTTTGTATLTRRSSLRRSLSALATHVATKTHVYIPFVSEPRTAKVRSLRSTAVATNVGELADFGSAGTATTTTTANFAIGDDSERYRNATTSVAADPPAVGTAAAGTGWRDAVALNTTERTRYNAGTWTARFKVRKTGQTITANVTIRVTWILYRVSSSGTHIAEIGRGVSADTTITTADITFSASFTTSTTFNLEAGEKLQVEVYVQNIAAGLVAATAAAYNIVLLQDQTDANNAPALTAQPGYVIFYARTLAGLSTHVVTFLRRLPLLRRSLVVSSTGVTSIRRHITKHITVTTTGVTTIRRSITKFLTASAVGVASIRKFTRRTLTASSNVVAVLTRRLALRRTLQTTTTGDTTLDTNALRRRLFTVVTTVSTKAFAKMPFALIPQGGGAIIRQVKKFFPVFDD